MREAVGSERPSNFRIWSHPGSQVALCWMSGPPSRGVVLSELERAYQAGDIRAGQDRVVLIDPSVDLNDAIATDLYVVQQRVVASELQTPARRRYRSVFVSEPTQTALALDVFFLFWQRDQRVVPEFFRCSSLTVAGILAGIPDIEAAFAARTQPPTRA